MTGVFADLIAPVFQYVINFQEGLRRGEQPPLDMVKRALVRIFDEAEKQASVAPDLARDFELAKYGLVYWVDEILITSTWQNGAAWKNNIIELHYYKTRKAANDFWKRADAAEAQARANKGIDPLETYFLCASFGFRGELIFDEDELKRWFDRIYHIIFPGLANSGEASQGAMVWGLKALTGGQMLVGMSLLVSATAVLTTLVFIAAIHALNY